MRNNVSQGDANALQNPATMDESSKLTGQQFDNLPVAVFTCNKDGYITAFNRAAVNLWGRTPEIGKEKWVGSWKIFGIDGREISREESPMARTIKTSIAVEGEEVIIERPDGTRVFVQPYPLPTFNAAGELIGAVNTLIDITEQRKSETKQAMLAAI